MTTELDVFDQGSRDPARPARSDRPRDRVERGRCRLIYGIEIGEGDIALIRMTTTSEGCPAAQFLLDAVRERATATGVATEVEVRLTFNPPWSPDMMAA